MRCHPIRWLWGLIPIAMLSWIAVHLEADRIEHDLEQRAGSALRQAGHEWASVVFSGRDGVLVGTAPDRDEARRAVALVRNLWGVSRVEGRVRLAEEVKPRPGPKTAPPTEPQTEPKTEPKAEATTEREADPKAALLPRAPEPPASAHADKLVLPPLGATVTLLAPIQSKLVEGQTSVLTPTAAPMSTVEPDPDAAPDPGPETVRAWEQETEPEANSGAEKTQDPQDPPGNDAVETAALTAASTRSAEVCLAAVHAINAVEPVHFARGEYDLDGRSRGVLDRFAVTAGECPDVGLRVVGHADARGRAKRNLALSEQRARAVVTYLIDKGIDGGRLKAVGYGETRPVAPNDTAENRAKNRRIEVEITGASPPP
jgi:outer membrane protein OmpA-like peptidoglycan-associated protein